MHNQVFQRISVLEIGGRNRLGRRGWRSELSCEGRNCIEKIFVTFGIESLFSLHYRNFSLKKNLILHQGIKSRGAGGRSRSRNRAKGWLRPPCSEPALLSWVTVKPHPTKIFLLISSPTLKPTLFCKRIPSSANTKVSIKLSQHQKRTAFLYCL